MRGYWCKDGKSFLWSSNTCSDSTSALLWVDFWKTSTSSVKMKKSSSSSTVAVVFETSLSVTNPRSVAAWSITSSNLFLFYLPFVEAASTDGSHSPGSLHSLLVEVHPQLYAESVSRNWGCWHAVLQALPLLQIRSELILLNSTVTGSAIDQLPTVWQKIFYSILKINKYTTLKYFDTKYKGIFIISIKYKLQSILYLKYIF